MVITYFYEIYAPCERMPPFCVSVVNALFCGSKCSVERLFGCWCVVVCLVPDTTAEGANTRPAGYQSVAVQAHLFRVLRFVRVFEVSHSLPPAASHKNYFVHVYSVRIFCAIAFITLTVTPFPACAAITSGSFTRYALSA